MNSATSGKAVSSREWVGDAWGGLAAMLVALPSAIAFGVAIFSPLVGVPAAQGALAGMLGATALGLLTPPFGSRSRLISAPSAPVAAVLTALAVGFTEQGASAPTILIQIGIIGLLTGVIQISFGVVRIGRLIKFIPFPVVSGYLSGVGVIIIGSQIPKFLGVPDGVHLFDALRTPSLWMWQSIVVGGVVVAAMLLMPRVTKAVPAAILALLTGCATYLLLALFDPGLMTTESNPLVIGSLGGGDASVGDAMGRYWLAFSSLGVQEVVQVLAPALTLAALLSIDTLKTGLVVDTMTNSHHDPDRELIGQGIGNIAASIIGGVPGSGTMGASMVNLSSGARTWHAAFMAGVFSLLAFLLLSSLVAWVPIAALAGILIVVGFRMIDRHSLAFFYSPATRLDFLVILSVILVAVFGDLIAASAVGVALAIILFIREQTRSSVVRHRIEGQEIISKRTQSELETPGVRARVSNMVVFELQGSLFFGTASQLQAALEPEAAVRKYVILSMRRVQSLDVTATHVLEQIKDTLEQHKGYLVFCDIPKGLPSGLKMKRFLKDTGVVRPTDSAFTFRQLDEALEWIESQELAEQSTEASAAVSVELANMPFLAGCSEEAMSALAANVELRLVKAGKRLFKAGGDADSLYFLRRGAVKLTVPIHKKESYHLATCGPGDLIGAKGFIEVHRQAMDALALTDSDVYVLTREGFEVLAVDHSDLAVALVGKLARDLAMRLHTAITEVQVLRG